MDWQEQLISLYLFVCKHYQMRLKYYCERMTNFADLSFSNEEVITLFLFGVIKKQKDINNLFLKESTIVNGKFINFSPQQVANARHEISKLQSGRSDAVNV